MHISMHRGSRDRPTAAQLSPPCLVERLEGLQYWMLAQTRHEASPSWRPAPLPLVALISVYPRVRENLIEL